LSWEDVVTHIGTLVNAMVWTDEPYDRDRVFEFWSVLGLDPVLCEELASMNFKFRDGRLHCNASMLEFADGIEIVHAAIMGVLAWEEFNDSRWLSMGPSARVAVAAILLGLDKVVELAIAAPGCDKFHLGGWHKFDQHCRMYAAVMCIVCWPVESTHSEIVKDDRVVCSQEAAFNAGCEELDWMNTIHPYVWQRLGEVAGMSAPEFCSVCKTCAHRAFAFLYRRAFRHNEERPWSMAKGDVEENLRNLAAEDDVPTEENTMKVWRLLRETRMPWSEIHEGVSLARSVSKSTKGVEEAHASASARLRRHKRQCMLILSACSLVHASRVLIFDPPEDDDEKLITHLNQ